MKNQIYETSDIQLASFLYAEGIDLLRLDRSNPIRKEFIFKDESRVSMLVSGFWQDTARISPRKLFSAFKELKNKLYQ